MLPFELASVVLLVAMIAAIALTFRGRKDVKSQDIAAQVRVKSGDRLKIIKMDAEKSSPELDPPASTEAAPK